jgi:hypothetical protein
MIFPAEQTRDNKSMNGRILITNGYGDPVLSAVFDAIELFNDKCARSIPAVNYVSDAEPSGQECNDLNHSQPQISRSLKTRSQRLAFLSILRYSVFFPAGRLFVWRHSGKTSATPRELC